MSAIQVLQQVFGHDQFKPPQASVIERTLKGGHSLVILPTGAGKSVCFQIPAILFGEGSPKSPSRPLTMVLSPLIALMKDQVDSLRSKGIEASYINSSLDRKQRESRYQSIRDGEYCLLYVTPERFRKPEFLEAIAARDVKLLAIDEAHCISQWGHDFRPDYSLIPELRRKLGHPTTLCLTATATPEVQQDILRQLELNDFGEDLHQCKLFHQGIDRPNLSLEVLEVWGTDEKLNTIINRLNQGETNRSGIIYFTLIKTLLEFSDRLRSLKIPHACYHGDLERTERKRIQDHFMKGAVPLVLATNAFGMGIDKEDIRLVIHADVPGSMESYYQEIGRAGRDGNPAECLLLYDQRDLATQLEFIGWKNPDADFYCRVYDLLLHEADSVRSFGVDWLRTRLLDRNQHDRRLETVLSMFERYGLIDDEFDLTHLEISLPIPESLASQQEREAKKLRDHQKLYALVEYVRTDNRREFIANYFGVPN